MVALCSTDRARIISIAREWIGTPYHHQASLKGVGCDCIGLVRGVLREFYGSEPSVKINYSTDWGDSNGNEDIIQAGFDFLAPISTADALPGDLIAVRWRRGLVAKHVMILTSETTAVHAINDATVTEIPISSWWRNKIAQVFQFPEQATWQPYS